MQNVQQDSHRTAVIKYKLTYPSHNNTVVTCGLISLGLLADADDVPPMHLRPYQGKHQMWITVIILWFMVSCEAVNDWDLPVFPAVFPSQSLGNKTSDKLIPRHLWIAVRDASDGLNYQMPALFERNSNWEVHVTTNEEKDKFMNVTFQNTSLLWAYHIISSQAGAAKADIWRYAVLWAYGGAYIDDDSDMKVPLDKMIEPMDTLIVAYERNGYNGDGCYVPRFKLSDFSAFRNATVKAMNIFHGRILLNWAMVSAPRHPIVIRTMENVVEIIRHEYFQDSLMRHLKAAYRWQLVMCATGPSVLTGSAREMIVEAGSSFTYKLADVDFRDYGGKFKAVTVKVSDNPHHYMNMHKNKHIMLLSSYLPEPPLTHELLLGWSGRAVQGHNGKQIFVMEAGKRRGIQSYDTFMALNYTMSDVHVMSDERLELIPQGDPMPYLDYPGRMRRRRSLLEMLHW